VPEPQDWGSLLTRSTAILGTVSGLLAAISAFQPQWSAFLALGYVGWLLLAVLLLAAAAAIFLARRRRRSRLLDPDALRLDPANSAHLLGREGEIQDLVRISDAAPLVFLSGDSGAGKSALIRAGLVPRLLADARWRPILLDMGDRDFDRGLAAALGEAFWLALSDGERTNLGLAEFPRTHRALRALRTSRRVTSRRPLLLLDQIDDYQLRHRDRFLDPDLHTWRPTAATLAASRFWRWLAATLRRQQLGVLLVTRSDNYSALDGLRLAPEPASYPLPRLPAGYVVPIVDKLTRRPADAPQVVVDPEIGWAALIERLGTDLESSGQLLPQQLKTCLLGLRSLQPLNVRAYERIDGAEGLEALFVGRAVAEAANAAGLDGQQVLAFLLALVDRKNRRKGETRSSAELAAATGLADRVPAVEQALRSLAAPGQELVRPTTTGWQLDHDYLARGILKAEANANRWRVRLAERAEQHEAAPGAWAWWRTLLTPSEQVAFALAWLRGKRPYGDRLGFARLSSLRLLPTTSLVVLAVVVVYVVNQSWVSTTVHNSLGTDQDLSEEEAKALVELADASLLARAFVAWGISLDAHLARKAEPKAASVIRAITRTDAAAASRLRDWIVDPAILSSEPAIRAFGSAAVTAIDPDERVVAAVLAAKDDPFATCDLAQAYAAAARKLPEDKAPQAVAAVLAAMAAAKDDPFATRDLAQAYATAAQKLPAKKRGKEAEELLATAGWCLAASSTCFEAVSAGVQALDTGRPLPARTERVVEILKFPQSAALEKSPLAQLAASPDAVNLKMPSDFWPFVAWVAKTYPEIDLTSGPSVERLAAVGGS
jgi:hypothetical protein